MFNLALAKLLTDMGDLLELNQDNPFRVRAFRRAAMVVESYPEDLKTLSREALLEIPGIGKGLADIIEEYRRTGKSTEVEKIKKKYPSGVLQIMRLPGMGPRKASVLYSNLQIDSLQKLASSARHGVLKTLPGFGAKTEENILKNIAFAETASRRIVVPEALRIARHLESYLKQSAQIQRCELAGSARRWKETVGDLDFLCTSRQPEKAIRYFLDNPDVARVLAAGTTKASVILLSGLQCDVRVVEEKSFGAALLYFTGSKEHNVRLRELALKKGYSLNEYGLFKIKDKTKSKPVAGETEKEIYEFLGLRWIPPELREDRGEIEAAQNDTLPNLVEVKDILGDFHNHTTLSDGSHSLAQMAEAAKGHGWKWFFSADHSPSLKIASGLPVPVLRKKMAEVKKLDKKSAPFRVFTSTEVDILADGSIDYPDAVLKDLDCVVASVHTRFNQDQPTMTDRICKALSNPHVDILGHPTGRLINKRPSYAVDMEAVLQTAKKTETAVEINGQPDRQELTDVLVKRAVELGVPLAVDTDAHSIQDLDHMVTAVHIARRGWVEKRHLLNTMAINPLLEWLK